MDAIPVREAFYHMDGACGATMVEKDSQTFRPTSQQVRDTRRF